MPLPSACGFLAIVTSPLPSFLPTAGVTGFLSLPPELVVIQLRRVNLG